jgi:ABC-type branched-subunit amino acid transport system ATPase component
VILTAHFFPQGLLPTKRELAGLAPRRFMRPASQLLERGEPSPTKNAGESIHGWGDRPAVTPGELTIVGVTKRFGAMTAVDSVSLTIQPGSVTALIGPNGAGKTTLLDIVAGDQRPTEGRILLNGEDVTPSGSARRARSGIGRTYQKLRLVATMTCRDVVLVGVDLAARRETAVTESDRRSRAYEALRLVGLESHASITCGALTFGQRRLLEMARAMATQPRLLLLDEPSSGLDDSEVPDFAELIRRVNENGCTVILVEHNLPFVQSVAADVIALDRGRLLAHGSAADVFALPEFRRSYLGELVEP